MAIRPAVVLVLATLSLAACYSPEGGIYPYSGGPKTYYSLETRPVTLRFVDLRDESVIFEVNVPPGQQFVYDFVPDKGDNPDLRPDLMRYETFEIGKKFGSLGNSVTVPGQFSRRVDVFYTREIQFAESAEGEELRRDPSEAEANPDWWSPEGGKQPTERRGLTNYDG
jgi:hypothetical protein